MSCLGSQDDHHVILAEFAWHRDGGAFLDGRVFVDLGFYFERRDIFAAPSDRVFDAVDIEKVAVFGHAECVAGVEPTVAPGLDCGFGILVVAVIHRPGLISADDQLPGGARRNFDVIVVDDAQGGAIARATAISGLCWVGR